MLPKLEREERDREICQLYITGVSSLEIGRRFDVSRQRVRQILIKANIFKNDRPRNERDTFLGVDVTRTVKDAIHAEAERRGISMSALTFETMSEMLTKLGYPLEAEKFKVEHGV